MPSRGISQVFDNVDEGFAVVFDAIRAGNETSARLYRLTIDEMQQTAQERTDLARLWAGSPTDLARLSRAVLETWQERARRRAGLARSFLGEAVGAGRETRDAVEAGVLSERSTAPTGAAEAHDQLRQGAREVAEQAGAAAARSVAGEARDEPHKGEWEGVEQAGAAAARSVAAEAHQLRRGASEVAERPGVAARNAGRELRKALHQTAESAEDAVTRRSTAPEEENGDKPQNRGPSQARRTRPARTGGTRRSSGG